MPTPRIAFVVERPIEGFVIALGVSTLLDLPIRTTWTEARPLVPGRYEALFINDGIHLADAQYKLIIGLSDRGRSMLDNAMLKHINSKKW